MKIKRLDITGFKSFLDKNCIDFPAGISAIVGPNGCGKSNIVDALRWVMGEQSVKQLRGKSMEDIIFAGADEKFPLNMAEVSLTLSNDNGSAPEEFKDLTEIMLTRRLYRSGESGYFINKQPARLKDIHNIFLGSGMGAKSYAVIQQGNIGAITDAGPDERRIFIEEAAGVTRYKLRKKEALQKVQSTEQNLFRLKDILAEIERQMRSLKRQANKARIYQTYKNHIYGLEVVRASRCYENHAMEIEKNDELLASLKDCDIEDSTQLQQLNAAVEDVKLKRFRKKQELSQQHERKFELQRNIDRTETTLSHLQDNAEQLTADVLLQETAKNNLEQKNEEIENEISQLSRQASNIKEKLAHIHETLKSEQESVHAERSRLAELKKQLESNKSELMDLSTQEARCKNIYQNAAANRDNLNRRLKKIDEQELLARKKTAQLENQSRQVTQQLEDVHREIESLDEEMLHARTQLDRNKTTLKHHIKSVQTFELEQGKLKSQLATLKKMEGNLQWYKKGVKAVLKSSEIDGIIGLTADMIEPEPSFETAAEAALGETLQYVIVKDQTVAQQGIDFLKTNGLGRCGFIMADRSGAEFSDTPDKNSEWSDSLLTRHVSIDSEYESLIASLMNRVIVTDSIQEAMALEPKVSPETVIVTRDGDTILGKCVMIGGSHDTLDGILIKKHEIKTLEMQTTDLNDQLQCARQNLKESESTARENEKQLQHLIECKNQSVNHKMETEKQLVKVEQELKHARRHLDILCLEQEQLQGEEFDLDDEMSRHIRTMDDLTRQIEDAGKKVADTTGKIDRLSSSMAANDQRVVDLRLEQTSLNAEHDNIASTLRRLHGFLQDGVHQLTQLILDIETKRHHIGQCKLKTGRTTQDLRNLYDEFNRLDEHLSQNEAAYHEIDKALKENDRMIAGIQTRREKTLQKIRLLEIEQTQRITKRDSLVQQLEEKYHDGFHTLTARFKNDAAYENLKMEEIKTRLEDYKQKISKITDVNLGAVKEFEALESRSNFLNEQRDDLVKAIEDLHKVIKKINRITHRKFTETLQKINEKLTEVFPLLFEGGTAKLVLTVPDKPLESGVEFMIHPPGKKLTRLSLLSGGEKALSAIAFIFSIFLIKPSSFCLLDEIDAPLDEANVIKFNQLLQKIGEKSQIIMITHNKRSMEFADLLIGITMEQKGVSKIVSVNLNRMTH